MEEERFSTQVQRISIMYQQEERDDFAKETEKEQLERWKES